MNPPYPLALSSGLRRTVSVDWKLEASTSSVSWPTDPNRASGCRLSVDDEEVEASGGSASCVCEAPFRAGDCLLSESGGDIVKTSRVA